MSPGGRILTGTTTDAGRPGDKNPHPVGPRRSDVARTPRGPLYGRGPNAAVRNVACRRGKRLALQDPDGFRVAPDRGLTSQRCHGKRPRDVTTPRHNGCGTPVALAHPGDRRPTAGRTARHRERVRKTSQDPRDSANRSPFLHPRGGVFRDEVKSDQRTVHPPQEPLEARSSDESCRRSRSLTTRSGRAKRRLDAAGRGHHRGPVVLPALEKPG